MSTSTTTTPPPQTPTTTPLPYRPLLYTLLLTTPLLALLPPRKLDLYTFTLASAFLLSAQELAFGDTRRRQQRTGNTGVMGILGRAQTDGVVGEREARLRPGLEVDGEGDGDGEGGVKGMVKKVWMGEETEGWQGRRIRKEREELEGGKGYGDIILGQVREVFPGFGGKREEGEGGEEKGE